MARSPLSRLEIQAWERDEFIHLARWERRAILRIDAEFRIAMTPGASSSTSKPASEAVEES